MSRAEKWVYRGLLVLLLIWAVLLTINTKKNNNWIKAAQPTLQQVKVTVLGPGGGTSDVPPAPGNFP